MKQETSNLADACPRYEIAAYVDGELDQREELDLEMHMAVCSLCTTELNEQKKLLHALAFALEDEAAEIELPENFTRVVVANAESKVQGLRCPRERSQALFVCVALFLLILIGFGADTATKTAATFGAVGEQFFAVGSFFLRLVHDLTIAATVILRSLCTQFVFKSTLTAIGLGLFFVFSLFILSRLMTRQNRF